MQKVAFSGCDSLAHAVSQKIIFLTLKVTLILNYGIIFHEDNCHKLLNKLERWVNMYFQQPDDRKIYLQILKRMSPEERLLKAFELSEFAKQLFIHGLRKRFPDFSNEEIKKIYLERIEKCHNRNY